MAGPPANALPATHRLRRRHQLVIWVVLILSAAMILAALVLGFTAQPGHQPIVVQGRLAYIGGMVITLGYGFVFAVLATRRPENPVGWIFGAVALINSASNLVWAYVSNATETIPPRLPIPEVVGWIGGLTFQIYPYFFILLILRFPDGKPLSHAWGRWADVAAALGVIGVIFTAFAAGRVPNYGVVNPFAVPGALGDAFAALAAGVLVVQVLLLLPAIASLVIRYRRADRIGRLQLKWFTYAVAVLAVIGIAYILVRESAFTSGSTVGDITWLAFCTGATSIPVAALIAILRHDLYQIDTIIGRTFVYGALTAILAGVYTAGIRLFNWIFAELTGESSDLPLVLTTLVLATTFTPIKVRLERIAAERWKEPDEAEPPPGRALALDLDDPQVEAFAQRIAEIMRGQERREAKRRPTSSRRSQPR
ncbi:MAG TPA: hypothetical protein VEW45_03780 [Candidatus Dormibacteraeota bacterium]|nr:hypothetical protein [Candidatus Dormibacteraeota bacterium]